MSSQLGKMLIDGELREMPSARDGRLRRGHLLMMLATVLIATSFPVGAAITHGLDSLVLTFLRFTLATVSQALTLDGGVAHALESDGAWRFDRSSLT